MEEEKDLRNKKILDLHNSGSTIKEIIEATGMSKSGIYKVIGSVIKEGSAPGKEVAKVDLSGDEEVIASFNGLTRINVNEYADDKTGEVLRITFVKSTVPGGFGKFVKLK